MAKDRRMPEAGPNLHVRHGDVVAAAPEADQEVARSYPQWSDKGAAASGYRITVLCARRTYQPGEPVRIIHACESLTAEGRLFVMGPKPVRGEYVDGDLASSPFPAGEDPLAPSDYDGRVVIGPGTDFNYEITEYHLESGRHTVQWRLGPYVSNTLVVTIRAPGVSS
jgi:hypothetical protein